MTPSVVDAIGALGAILALAYIAIMLAAWPIGMAVAIFGKSKDLPEYLTDDHDRD